MSSTIPPFGWPVPEDDDLLADGAGAIRALAAAVGGTITPVVGNWKTYTPTFSQDGGAGLAVGNGSISGLYRVEGQVVHARVLFQRGSTTNQGTANYLFGLPVVSAGFTWVHGFGMIQRGGTTYWPVSVTSPGGPNARLVLTDGRAIVGPSSPVAWAANDVITFSVTYLTTPAAAMPEASWTKTAIKVWLVEHGVSLTEEALSHLTKAELLALVADLTDSEE